MYIYTILVNRQVKKMLYYELKKVFLKKSNIIALFLLSGIVLLAAYLAIIEVKWVNEKGDSEKGLAAIHNLRFAQNQWSGSLTSKKIEKVLNENKRINQTKEANSKNVAQNNIAYGWKQGFMEIRNLINSSFGSFREYDYFLVDRMSADKSSQFYRNRLQSLETWLDGEAKDFYSAKEKQFLVSQYKELKTPLYYEYAEGWKQLFEYAPSICMLCTLIVGFIISGIFPNEIGLKTDAVFYSSYHGRNKATAAKVKAGVLIISGLYWLSIFIYSFLVLGILGIDGINCPIQIDWGNWKSFYNITFLQEYFLIVFGGYLGCIFIGVLTMFVSVKTKSSVIAVIVPFIIIFAPGMLAFVTNPLITKLLGLLPDGLLQMNLTINMFNLYQIGGKIIGSVPILFILYFILIPPILPLIYQLYRKYELN